MSCDKPETLLSWVQGLVFYFWVKIKTWSYSQDLTTIGLHMKTYLTYLSRANTLINCKWPWGKSEGYSQTSTPQDMAVSCLLILLYFPKGTHYNSCNARKHNDPRLWLIHPFFRASQSPSTLRPISLPKMHAVIVYFSLNRLHSCSSLLIFISCFTE